MSAAKKRYRKKLSREQQDYVLELIAEETGSSDNVTIIQKMERVFGISLKSPSVQYYRGEKFQPLIANKRDANNEIIKAKVPLANRLNRVMAFADMHNEIKWRLSGIVHHQGRVIAEIEKKEYGAKIKCLENIRAEMEPVRKGADGEGDNEGGISNTGSGTINVSITNIERMSDDELADEKRRNEKRLEDLGFIKTNPRMSRHSSDN